MQTLGKFQKMTMNEWRRYIHYLTNCKGQDERKNKNITFLAIKNRDGRFSKACTNRQEEVLLK